MSTRTAIKLGAVVAAVGAVVSLSACAPGGAAPSASSSLGSVSKDVAAAGDVTLTVWDQNTDGGIADAQEQLNDAFMKQYPNVTIERTAQSFSDLKTTLKLALSSNTPPDVVQANQGYPDMGAFVEAGMLRPVDDYAALYGWDSYYPKGLLKQNSFSSDGKQWQGDSLYGVSQTGELVGVYYNKALLSQLGLAVPETLADLESDMAAAKAAGILPLAFGNLEKSPGIHLFGVTQAAVAGAKAVNALVSGESGSWTDPASLQAAQTLADWSTKGYLTEGANGVSRDDALTAFTAGSALFDINGTWQQQTLTTSMGDGVGFVALDSVTDGTPATTGGQGLAWAITSKSAHPDVAAAYIDFVTNAKAAQVLLDTGNLPTVLPEAYSPKDGTLAADIAAQYRAVQAANGVVPYLDYSTPTFYDTLTASVQDLVGGRATPQQFVDTLQADYSSFLATK